MDTWTAILGFILGGGFLTFLQFLINRHDSKKDKDSAVLSAISTLSDRVSKIENTLDQREAVLARTHILRFTDELYNGVKHSQDYFLQTLDDIETYNQFCEEHPKFANGRTKAAAKYIEEEYERLFKAHKL